MSKRLGWAGHMSGGQTEDIIKKAMIGKINRKKTRGKLKQRWVNIVEEDLNKYAQGLDILDSKDRRLVEVEKVLNVPLKKKNIHTHSYYNIYALHLYIIYFLMN